ncbi:MAG: sigma-70 family RNA polymerase sigma factor [Dehalococcoidia bacterium]
MRDEKGLIERARKNDPEAFGEIYEEHFDKIYRYVLFRVSDIAEAEDLTQQVFLKVVRSISSFKWRGAPFSSWLFRIAHNQVVDFYRKTAKMRTTSLDQAPVVASSDPVSIAEHDADFQQVKGAIGGLTRLQQEVISLRFAGELSTAETAKIMGKSLGAVKALQHSALAALRKTFSGMENHGE